MNPRIAILLKYPHNVPRMPACARRHAFLCCRVASGAQLHPANLLRSARRKIGMARPMRENCRLVIIRWQDSAQPMPSWQYLSSLPRTRPVECATVGWLLTDDDDVKVICQSVGNLESAKNAQASGIMTIPARCVISVENLIEVEELTSSSDFAGIAGPAAVAADPQTGPALMPREFESHPA